MVHALDESQRVLKSGGSLIDLRPTIRNRQIELELDCARLNLGEIDSSSAIADHEAADLALQNARERGLFRAEHSETFEYTLELDSLADLQDYAAGLQRSTLPQAIDQRIQALTAGETAGYIIRIRREMQIARYRKSAARA